MHILCMFRQATIIYVTGNDPEFNFRIVPAKTILSKRKLAIREKKTFDAYSQHLVLRLKCFFQVTQ